MLVLGGFLSLLTIYILQARGQRDLSYWHSYDLPDELDGDDSDDFDRYLAREEKIFAELAELIEDEKDATAGAPFNRFTPNSLSNPAGRAKNWNRTFIIEQADPAGAALLIHGLSDSPYSMRAVSETFEREGYDVIGLRVPGHGTVPGALREARAEDWKHAVNLATRHLAERLDDGETLVLVGYSNGAALAVNQALTAVEDGESRIPDQLILISPALRVSSLAALARVQLGLAQIPGLSKLAWTDVLLEFDPYKYNSFAVQAGRQIWRLTRNLYPRTDALTPEQRASFPPVLAFVSAVDATVPASAITEYLPRLGRNGSEVVVFGVNRVIKNAELLHGHSTAFLAPLLEAPSLSYDLTMITNLSDDSYDVIERTKKAGSPDWNDRALHMAWPRRVFSLSHVALPFRVDDPLYGVLPDLSAVRPLPSLGALDLKGERGVVDIPPDLMMRLRHNPFFEYMDARIAGVLD